MDSQHSNGPALATHHRPSRGWIWGVVALAIAITVLFVVLHAVHNVDKQVAALGKQVQETQQTLTRVERTSDAARAAAVSAQTNAEQAAQERNEAVEAKAKSEKDAAAARQQAQAATQKAAVAEQKAEQFRQQREQELNRLQSVLGQIAETHRTSIGLVVTLGSNSIHFDFDKAALHPKDKEILSRIAGILSTLKGYHISVYGYTDDIGTPQYNLKLSERRAKAVRDYLVQAGLDPAIMTTKGFGASDPRAPGNSPAARAKNRRVEIGLVDYQLQSQGSMSRTSSTNDSPPPSSQQ